MPSERRAVEWVRIDRQILSRVDAARRRARVPPAAAMAAPVPPLDAAAPRRRVAALTMTEALEQQGVPRLAGLTPEQEAVEFLKYAVEVEHGLMVQYLYAMYSANNPAIQGTLKRIAIEEMGHLITVLNLLAAAGEPPHLERYDWGDRTFAPFQFALEGVSQLTLAKYTACEMPERDSPNIDPQQRLLLDDILADAAASAGVEPSHVGLLYAKIYWLLRAEDRPVNDPADEPWDGFPVDAFASTDPGRHVGDAFFTKGGGQAQPSDWVGNQTHVIVTPIAGRTDALGAISDITEQGEGFGGAPEGHFDLFVDAYRIAKGATGLARPVPVNPWYAGSGSPPGTPQNEITSGDGVSFAELGDRLYQLVLLSIRLHYALAAGTDPVVRASIAPAALLLMTDCLAKTARTLVDLERDGSQPSPPQAVAHLCFTRPSAHSSNDATAVRAEILRIVDESVGLADRIAATTQKLLRKTVAKTIASRLRGDIRPIFEAVAP
jgi:ferritin-like protein